MTLPFWEPRCSGSLKIGPWVEPKAAGWTESRSMTEKSATITSNVWQNPINHGINHMNYIQLPQLLCRSSAFREKSETSEPWCKCISIKQLYKYIKQTGETGISNKLGTFTVASSLGNFAQKSIHWFTPNLADTDVGLNGCLGRKKGDVEK